MSFTIEIILTTNVVNLLLIVSGKIKGRRKWLA
jgi:hypothetical protein